MNTKEEFQNIHGGLPAHMNHGNHFLAPLLLAMILVNVFCLNTVIGGQESQTKAIRRSAQAQSQTESLQQGDLYALAVGVSNYGNPKVPKLNLSAKDAKDFSDFMDTQKKVFKNVQVKVLLNEQATKQEVEKFLYYELRNAGKDDSVVLFFSGHGASDPGDPGAYYFLTYDSDPKFLHATAVDMAGLKFLSHVDSKRLLLVADACHAGGFSKVLTKSVEAPLEKVMRLFGEASGRVILSSSKPNEYSQERPDLPNSVFTYYLLKALKGEADIDRSGVVTLKNAYDYVYEHTKAETEGAQHPQLEGAVTGQFPLSVLGKLDDSLSVDVWFVAQDPKCSNPICTDPPEGVTECPDSNCGDVTIKDGSTLYTGQNYQIGFRPKTLSYVYIYQIDSQGTLVRLFPGKDYMDPSNQMENPLKGGEIYWFPGKNAWLRLDNHEGQEKIYVIASRSRNAYLEGLYNELESSRQQGGGTTVEDEVKSETVKEVGEVMAPTKAITRKMNVQQNGAVPAKIRSFEDLSHAIESAKLDVAESIWFWHKGR